MELLIINYLFYLLGVIIFIINRKHFLIILLRLELIVLSVFLGFFILLNCEYYNIIISLIYLTISVCEGVLGLSLMVIIIRSVGNDIIIRYSMLW